MKNGRGWTMVALLTLLVAGACGLSSPATTSHDGGVKTGTVTDACMYTLGVLTCQTWTSTASDVAGEVSACEKVYGGTEIASCPTAGILGRCINLTTNATNETSVIYYYQDDAGTLSLADLCDSASGTYAPGS